MYPSYGMEVRYTELETSVTRGCRSLQGYTEEFVCGIQSSYFRMEVTDVSPFALSIYHFLHFKLSVESSTQSQPLQDICL
jgi:hypothetical protein